MQLAYFPDADPRWAAIEDFEDQVLDGPASAGKGSKGEPCMYCNLRTAIAPQSV